MYSLFAFLIKINCLGCIPGWPEATTRPTASRLLLFGIRKGSQPTDQIERQHHGRYFTHHHQLRKSVGVGFFILVMATIGMNPIEKEVYPTPNHAFPQDFHAPDSTRQME